MSAQILTFPAATNSPCAGCACFQMFQGDMTCLNLISWRGGVPANPPCYEREGSA